MDETVYNWDRALQSKIRQISQSDLSPKNKKAILDFSDECFAIGLGKARVVKYLHYLQRLAKWLGKDFEDCTKEDIKRLVGLIERSPYASFSKKEYKICIKKLFKWLRDTDDYPPEVRWIKPSSGHANKLKLPEDMLNEQDIKKLIEVEANPRNKAFISLLYESGCRISEQLFLKIKSIKFDEYGAIIIIPCMKTGSRRIRIVSSVPYLKEWLNRHPLKHDPEAYIWLTNRLTVMSYAQVTKILKNAARKAGIKKKVNPHNFRHSRATYLANYLTEAQMKEFFGWTQGSEMAAIYVHLSGRDVDNAILKLYGKAKPETPEESILTPKTCSRCEMQNPSSNKFCSRCGLPLDKETMNAIIKSELERKNADAIMNQLLKDERFKALFEEKLWEISSNLS